MAHRTRGEVTLKTGRLAWGFAMKWAAVAGGVALACVASVASHAADLSPIGPYKAAPAYIPAYFNWTGYYVGVALGDGHGRTQFFDGFDSLTTSFSNNGLLVGGYTGVNYQVGSIVFGFEGDFTGVWAKGSAIDTFGDSLSTNIIWTSLVTARVGWAFDRVLLFVKGGGAFVDHRDLIAGPGPGVGTLPGGSAITSTWTLGGGIDWAMTEHWILRGEYDYMKLTGKGVAIGPPTGIAGIGGNFNEYKAGIAYKF